MKHHPIFLTLALIVGSTAIAQDDATVGKNDLETADPERDTTSEVVQAASPLNDLEWMVGRWIDQGEETTITTDCAWTHGGKFLSRSFSVVTVGEATLDGTQVIGWDPTTGQVRSWTFDSAGGFGTGRLPASCSPTFPRSPWSASRAEKRRRTRTLRKTPHEKVLLHLDGLVRLVVVSGP